jgi:hypothetical protein
VIRALAVLVALGAMTCGDNRTVVFIDARGQLDGSTDPDAPPASTFTLFVRDQILNQTSETTEPVPYGAFAILPDPDAADDDFTAYADLFP